MAYPSDVCTKCLWPYFPDIMYNINCCVFSLINIPKCFYFQFYLAIFFVIFVSGKAMWHPNWLPLLLPKRLTSFPRLLYCKHVSSYWYAPSVRGDCPCESCSGCPLGCRPSHPRNRANKEANILWLSRTTWEFNCQGVFYVLYSVLFLQYIPYLYKSVFVYSVYFIVILMYLCFALYLEMDMPSWHSCFLGKKGN